MIIFIYDKYHRRSNWDHNIEYFSHILFQGIFFFPLNNSDFSQLLNNLMWIWITVCLTQQSFFPANEHVLPFPSLSSTPKASVSLLRDPHNGFLRVSTFSWYLSLRPLIIRHNLRFPYHQDPAYHIINNILYEDIKIKH